MSVIKVIKFICDADLHDHCRVLHRLQFFHELPRFRILCCGGDGTVGWLLDSVGQYEALNIL